jgi:hypothetical protein
LVRGAPVELDASSMGTVAVVGAGVDSGGHIKLGRDLVLV